VSAAELDRVASLALLMRRAYPGRSTAFCIQRSAESISDVAVAVTEMVTAGRCAAAIALQGDGGHQSREQRQARWQALIDLAEVLRLRVDEEVAHG